MKKTTFLVAFCCLTFLSNAQSITPPSLEPSETRISELANSDVIASIDGIDIYYSTTNIAGNIILNVHFKNTNETTVTFNWEITKDGQRFQSLKPITLKPGNSFDQNAALEVKDTSNLTDYSITLTQK